MNHDDERDYAEEAANRRAMEDEQAAEAAAELTPADEAGALEDSGWSRNRAADLPRGELAAALSEPGGHSGGTAAAAVLVATAMHGDLLDQLRPFVTGDHRTAYVEWHHVIAELNGHGTGDGLGYLSGGGEAVLRIAASLAVGTPVDLRGMLGRLDRPNKVMAVRAVGDAAGVPTGWTLADVAQSDAERERAARLERQR